MIIPSLHPLIPDAVEALRLADFVLPLVGKATLVLAAAALLDVVLLRKATAATRHLAWCLAMAALLLLPVLSQLVPAWDVPVWRLPEEPVTRTGPAMSESYPQVQFTLEVPATEVAAPMAPAPAASASAPERALTLGSWVFLLWAAGVMVVIARLLLGQVGVWRLGRESEPLMDPVSRWMAAEAAWELGLSRPIDMLRSSAATMPMTWGLLRPTVLLPLEAEGWPEERRRVVLLHELAHVKRLDCLTQSLALLCYALYWFHPGAWWAARRMREERERACDDTVLDLGVRASVYASHLLEVARSYRSHSLVSVAAVAMARPSQLEGRVLAVLDTARSRRGPDRRLGLAAGCATLLLLLPVSALRPTAVAAERPDEAPAPESVLDTIPGSWRGVPPAPPAPRPEQAPHAPDAPSPIAAAPFAPFAPLAPVLGDWVQSSPAPHPGPAPRAALAPRAPGAAPQRPADPRVLAGLISVLDDRDAEVRRSAARGLGGIGDPRAVAALIEALRDPDAEVRRTAAWSLGEIGDPAAVEPLVAALRDSDAEVRRAAARALGEIEDSRAASALAAALRDGSAEVRSTAAWALSQMEDPEAVPGLIAALSDASAEVRKMAAHALGETEDRRAVGPLTAAIRDASPGVRQMAVWALAQIEDVSALPGLVAALADASPEVRKMAAHAIGEIEPAEAPPALIDALRDANAEVRKMAAFALAEIADPRSVPALRAALKDADAEVRRTALFALAEMDDPAALDAMIEALQDPDADVRRRAARALAEIR